jgi:hypothetical protein
LLPCGSGTGWFGSCGRFASRAEVDAGLAAHGAIDDGRLALDPRAEQALEQLGLGRAQVGQLGGQVLHRAVVLAETQAAVGGLDLGHEALLVQDLGQGVGPLGQGSAFHPSGVAGRQPLVSPGQELGQGGRVAALEEGQGLPGDLVVVAGEGLQPGVGEPVDGRGPSPPRLLGGRVDQAVALQQDEVAAHPDRGQLEAARPAGGARGAHGAAGARGSLPRAAGMLGRHGASSLPDILETSMFP